MVRIYKEWCIDADKESYIVGKRNLQGELDNPARYNTAAEAVNHIIEAEMREGISKPELLECCEFIAMYSAVADEVVDAVIHADASLPAMKHAARKPFRYSALRDVETRCKG